MTQKKYYKTEKDLGVVRVCRICGKEYVKEVGKGGRFFCSDECKRIAGNRRAKARYKPQGHKTICPVCGKEFITCRDHLGYCSPECREIAQRIAHREADQKRNQDIECHNIKSVCEWCGKPFSRRSKSRRDIGRFCSRECSDQWRRSKPKKPAPLVLVQQSQCAECGKLFVSQRGNIYCSKKCKIKALLKKSRAISLRNNMNRQWIARRCRHCGAIFTPKYKESKIFCSVECKHEHKRMSQRRNYKHRLDGKIVDTDISLAKLVARDHMVCALCGERVDMDDYTIMEDGTFIAGSRYPSIDHILPLAKGGLHEWSNVQLAHRECNWVKGDKVEGSGAPQKVLVRPASGALPLLIQRL